MTKKIKKVDISNEPIENMDDFMLNWERVDLDVDEITEEDYREAMGLPKRRYHAEIH